MSGKRYEKTSAGLMAWTEFVEVSGVAPERLQELVEIGWLRRCGTPGEKTYTEPDIYRVRKLERICGDFELPLLGGVIIVDLLERIDALEQRLRDLG